MTTILDSYNQAIKYLHHERYEEAVQLLEKLKLKLPNQTQVIWALGLGKIMMGYPHQALKLWKHLTVSELPNLKTSIDKVEQQLLIYEQLYETYNSAIHLIQNQQFQDANKIFSELLSAKKEVPLPIEFYEGYLLSSILIGEQDNLSEEIKLFPQYVQKHSKIENIIGKLNTNQTIAPISSPAPTNRWRKAGYGLGLVASLMIGAFSMNYFLGNEKDTLNQAVNNQVSSDQSNEFKQKVLELEGKINLLKSQEQELKLDLEKKNTALQTSAEVTELLSVANVDLTTLANKAGYDAYQKGKQAYENQKYQDAISFLNQSLKVQPNEYYSDDALYYLIVSKQYISETNDLTDLFDQFLLQKSSHYTASPYYDDILLAKGEKLLKAGDKDGALQIFELIQNEYPNEWTSHRSKTLNKDLMEE
jgi:tetratricopeptide (TPR) repeat protein